MKIYTRTGDKGQTSLFGGERVLKSHARVGAYGSLDELNSALGLALAHCRTQKKRDAECEWILQVQRDLFAVGSWLASKEASEKVSNGEEAFTGQRQARTHVGPERVTQLEHAIDGWEKDLAPMKSFLLPNGSVAGAQVHVARTLCRRSEREVIALRESGEIVPDIAVQYLNRLADALFTLARHLNRLDGVKEDPWT